MKGTVVARVRRVLHGHSERTLIHAVDEAGLESRIEVPSDIVRDLAPGQELTLMLTWTLQPTAPVAAPPDPAPAVRMPTALPSAADEEFMALMGRHRGASSASTGQHASPVVGPPTTAAEELARRLGIRRASIPG